jgi:hypothetical protein
MALTISKLKFTSFNSNAMKKCTLPNLSLGMALMAIILTSCSENLPAQQASSVTTEKRTSQIDWIDSTNNAYSNFIHGIGMKLPSHWSYDRGMSQHTIFRGMQPDSGISFVLNVVPVMDDFKAIQTDETVDLYEIYLLTPIEFQDGLKESWEAQVKSKIKGISIQKSYLKNRVCLKSYMTFDFRDFDVEYENTVILYQTATESRLYSIGMILPTVIYQSNKAYYENVFSQVSFITGHYKTSE